MKKLLSAILTILIILVTVTVIGVSASVAQKIMAELRPDLTVVIDGKTQTFHDANGKVVYPISYQGTTYLPLRAIGGVMGKEVGYNGTTNTVTLGTPAANATGEQEYSRSNPAPVGITQTLKTKDQTVEITILESYRGVVAWQMVSSANMFNDPPQDGYEYVVLKIRAKVITKAADGSVFFSDWSFKPFNAENVEYDRAVVVNPTPEFSGSVYVGGTLEGYATYQVKQSDSIPKLVYGANYDGTGGIWFRLAK